MRCQLYNWCQESLSNIRGIYFYILLITRPLRSIGARSADSLHLYIPPHSTNLYSNSFTVCSIRLWNPLPGRFYPNQFVVLLLKIFLSRRTNVSFCFTIKLKIHNIKRSFLIPPKLLSNKYLGSTKIQRV